MAEVKLKRVESRATLVTSQVTLAVGEEVSFDDIDTTVKFIGMDGDGEARFLIARTHPEQEQGDER